MDKVSLGTAEARIRHNQVFQQVIEQVRDAAPPDAIARAVTLRPATLAMRRRVAEKTPEQSSDG
jgi:hypothetical protein